MHVFAVEHGPWSNRCAFNGGLMARTAAGTWTNVVPTLDNGTLLLNVFRNQPEIFSSRTSVSYQYLTPEGRLVRSLPGGHVEQQCFHEDPRLVVFHGRLLLVCNNIVLHRWKRSLVSCRPILLPLAVNPSSMQLALQHPHPLAIGAQPKTALEKNWLFFEHQDDLLLVYSCCPLLILRAKDGSTVQEQHWEHPLQASAFATPGLEVHIRGGAPPVRVGAHYYLFTHTAEILPFPKRQYRLVIMQLCAVTLRLLSFSEAITPVETNRRVVFPVGAVFVEDQQLFLLSCGINDTKQILVHLPLSEVQAALQPYLV